MEAHPLDRGHQDKVTLLKQEISVIRGTLMQQRRIIDSSQPPGQGHSSVQRKYEYEDAPYQPSRFPAEAVINHYDPKSYVSARYNDDPFMADDELQSPASQLSPTDPFGVQGLLALDGTLLIDKRMRDFKEMNDRASDLETWVSLPLSLFFHLTCFISLLPRLN
jgi:hypothetical protein